MEKKLRKTKATTNIRVDGEHKFFEDTSYWRIENAKNIQRKLAN